MISADVKLDVKQQEIKELVAVSWWKLIIKDSCSTANRLPPIIHMML